MRGGERSVSWEGRFGGGEIVFFLGWKKTFLSIKKGGRIPEIKKERRKLSKKKKTRLPLEREGEGRVRCWGGGRGGKKGGFSSCRERALHRVWEKLLRRGKKLGEERRNTLCEKEIDSCS